MQLLLSLLTQDHQKGKNNNCLNQEMHSAYLCIIFLLNYVLPENTIYTYYSDYLLPSIADGVFNNEACSVTNVFL